MKKICILFSMLSCILFAKAEVVYSSDMISWNKVNAGNGNNWVNWANCGDNEFDNMSDEEKEISGCSNGIIYKYDSNYDADAWAISPAIALQHDITYTISVYACAIDREYYENWKLCMATGSTVANMEDGEVLINKQNFNTATLKAYTATVKPSADGDYYFGFNCYSEADNYGLAATGFTITASPVTVVSEIIEDMGNPVYYNLQGMEVKNPVKGTMYIVKQGDKVSKIVY